MEREYTLEGVREAIHSVHQLYPPEARTPKIKKLLEELYKIEKDLIRIKIKSITLQEGFNRGVKGVKNGVS